MYKVIVRSKPECPYCVKAKALLDSKGIEYEVIDIADRSTAIELFKALGFKSVPVVVDPEGTIICSYSELETHLSKQEKGI